MEVRVLFFASLREAVGTGELTVPVAESGALEDLWRALAERLPAEALAAVKAENVRLAVNQALAVGPVRLQAGDEVAFMPPVTGG